VDFPEVSAATENWLWHSFGDRQCLVFACVHCGTREDANTRTRWTNVHQLKAEGLGSHIIAHRLGLDPKTVRRYADAASPDDLLGPSPAGRRGLLDPFKPYLRARIDEGVTATSALLKEIRTGRAWPVLAVGAMLASCRSGLVVPGRCAGFVVACCPVRAAQPGAITATIAELALRR